MNNRSAIITLSAGKYSGTLRFVSQQSFQLSDGTTRSTVTITRTGTFTDPRYGTFEITRDMLLAMVANFDANAYGQDIFIDVAHDPDKGAAAKVIGLSVDGDRLRAVAEWTPYGIDAVKSRGFQYLSAEYHPNFTDNEAGNEHGPVLLGAGLTVRPVIKRLDPVQLSESNNPVLLHPDLLKTLATEATTMWKELLKKLTENLSTLTLAEAVIAQLLATFEATAKTLGEDKGALDQLLLQFEATGKTLAEQYGGQPLRLDIKMPEPRAPDAGTKTLSAADINQILDDRATAAATAAKKLADSKEANLNLFAKLLSDADGLKSLSEDALKTLSEASALITPGMTAEQVTQLAAHQIKLGDQLSVSTQLAGMGYQPAGSVRISHDDQRTALSLQEKITIELKKTAPFGLGKLKLGEKVSPFVESVLSEFDRLNAPQIHNESVRLAGGSTAIADTSLPIGYQRTVIREALSDLRVLELVNTLTDFSATATTQIPYETRDGSAVLNDGIVYEGQPIHRASVTQAMDLAYILPMKLAFLITNEVMHFSRSSGIDWDAYARNVESNARMMRELVVRRICNEIQRSSDAYLAAAVSNEGLDGQLDGSTHTVKTAFFPIVRPHQARDLSGSAVGSEENPLVVRLDGSAISPYDGSNEQSSGTYYRITSYNLGYVQYVTELGVPATPPNAAGADDISYSYATNIAKFDTDNGSAEVEKHLNGLLRKIGAKKAEMSGDRLILPDFMLMSPVLNDTITNAEQFYASNIKPGTGQDVAGDLEKVKGINAWSTNAPGVDLGDERLIMGQRGTTTYTVAKPFQTGTPFEAVDSSGKAVGKKQAYGEEFSAIKTPTPIRNRLTSVLAYSATGR